MKKDEWEQMRDYLMTKTVKELRKICKDEGICPGQDASRKHSLVGCIVSWRRSRYIDMEVRHHDDARTNG